jgi:hypothetical protein
VAKNEAKWRAASLSPLNKQSMAKYKLEYIWLDGYEPVANLRSKTLIKEYDSFPTLEQLPDWGFDGSSTRQGGRGLLRLCPEACRCFP